jgi:undecaprenyl pyrophosphate phosphatase UppP
MVSFVHSFNGDVVTVAVIVVAFVVAFVVVSFCKNWMRRRIKVIFACYRTSYTNS